jgi:hypothetical protein
MSHDVFSMFVLVGLFVCLFVSSSQRVEKDDTCTFGAATATAILFFIPLTISLPVFFL